MTVVRNDVVGLRRTALSVMQQTSQDFEWLIVDGYSIDGTAEYASELARDPRVRLVAAEPRGIYDAMNVGVLNARGNWLWLINAGDFLMGPGAVSTVGRWAIEDASAAAFACRVAHVSGHGYLLDISTPRTRWVGEYVVGEYNHQGVVCRRDLFDTLGAFDTSMRFGADGKFLDGLASAGRVELRSDILVGFTLGGASGRNYRATVAETNIFRPTDVSQRDEFILVLRNAVRVGLLDLEGYRLLGYPARRIFQGKQDRRLTARERDALLASHWPSHSRDGQAILSCCIRG